MIYKRLVKLEIPQLRRFQSDCRSLSQNFALVLNFLFLPQFLKFDVISGNHNFFLQIMDLSPCENSAEGTSNEVEYDQFNPLHPSVSLILHS